MTEWTITVDLVSDPDAPPATNSNAVGIVGPREAKLTSEAIKAYPGALRFRMKDDDDNIYYYGYLVGTNLMAPLDDFGMPNAGCTSIEVLENGHWQGV